MKTFDDFIYASAVLRGLADRLYRGIDFKNTRSREKSIRIVLSK